MVGSRRARSQDWFDLGTVAYRRARVGNWTSKDGADSAGHNQERLNLIQVWWDMRRLQSDEVDCRGLGRNENNDSVSAEAHYPRVRARGEDASDDDLEQDRYSPMYKVAGGG
jgi:hypothetical protein